MSSPIPGPSARTAVSRRALRIVLAGLPNSGKSSLLSSLAHAAKTQEHLLHGRLTDLSQKLLSLPQPLGEYEPQEGTVEVIPYPVLYEPFAGDHSAPIEAVLVDGDGRATQDLVAERRWLDDAPKHSLAAAIRDADALLVVVEAPAGPARLDADLAELNLFLRHLQRDRGREMEAGGLPVFVVLAKCEFLADPSMTSGEWLERITESKRQVERRLPDFLSLDKAATPLPFGSMRLHVTAAAIRHPALADSPEQPGEPYGVAELFRQCLHQARDFRERRRRSGRRLFGTVLISLGLIAALVSAAVVLVANRNVVPTSELLAKVHSYRSREAATPSARLREPLQARISELIDLRNDPDFAAMPAEEKAFIETRLQELQEYRKYWQQMQAVRSPAEATSDQELTQVEAELTKLSLPASHQSEWGQTEASLLRRQRLLDIQSLRAVVVEVQKWYQQIIRRGEALWTFAEHRPKEGLIPWHDWQTKVRNLLAETARPPFELTARIAGQTPVTYATVLRFDTVTAERFRWDDVRQRLQRVRDLSTALGLGGTGPAGERDPQARPAVLEIPPPSLFTADQAASRLQELERTYPRWAKEFQLAGLPEAIVPEIRQAARTSYDHLIEAGRNVILRRLLTFGSGGRDRSESWQALRKWLTPTPEELRSWRPLANLLARLHNPDASDPITALEAFLNRDRFPINLSQITVVIPDTLSMQPAGPLNVHYQGTEGQAPLAFSRSGEGQRDARQQATAYAFRRTPAASFTYRPGDTLWADLGLQDTSKDDWILTWTRSRSQEYQFERLSRPPRLHRKNQDSTAGRIVEGVTLLVQPEGGVPPVPELLPVVPVQ